MGASISANPIRLQCSTATNPAVAPIDATTGLQPVLWRSTDSVVQLAVFDPYGNPLDFNASS